MTDPRLYVQPEDLSPVARVELARAWQLYESVFDNLASKAFLLQQDMAAYRASVDGYRFLALAHASSIVMYVIRELVIEPTTACPRCGGEQEVVASGVNSGFAGGSVYWAQLACGHVDMDETDDVRAAR